MEEAIPNESNISSIKAGIGITMTPMIATSPTASARSVLLARRLKKFPIRNSYSLVDRRKQEPRRLPDTVHAVRYGLLSQFYKGFGLTAHFPPAVLRLRGRSF